MSSNKYQSPIERNNAFMVKVEDLVREIVIQNNIPYYRIESRMEHDPNANEGNAYLPIVRIITYFEDSVTPISDVLCSEFEVEMGPPEDKQNMRVDSFSSRHIEYKVGLKTNRVELIEYKRYGTKKFEIQVCSMLQDAWNGIERELGYNGSTIPEEARRDFYRVGALLEMADLEFLKIRSLLGKKQEEKTAPAQPAPVRAEAPKQTVNTQAPEIRAAEPKPQIVTPSPEPQKPITNVFASEPIAYEPAPQPTAPVIKQQPVAAPQINVPKVNGIAPQRAMPAKNQNISGIAPKKVSIDKTSGGNVSAIDMDINSNQTLAMDVNNVEKANGISKDNLADVVNIGPGNEQDPVHTQPQPEAVKLSIDNVETFNMNVNGMIEKTTEIIREQTPGDGLSPEDKAKNPQQPLDENAQMTDASLKEYVLNSKLLREIDSQISARAGAKLNDEIDIEGDVERLRYLKVFSLKQLHEKLTDHKNEIIAFAEKWIGKDNGGSFDMGICLFYLEYLLVGKKNDPGFAVEYVLKFISDNDYSARYIIPTYNAIRQADTGAPKFSHLTLK